MKIDDNQLAKAYREYVSEKMKHQGKSCPTIEEIVSCVRGEISRKGHKEIVAHIAECTNCLEIARSFLEIMKHEKRFEEDVRILLHEESRMGKEKRYPWRQAALKWAAACVVLIGALFLAYRLVFQRSVDDHERAGRAERIQIVQPSKVIADRSRLIIHWNDDLKSDQYVVEIYDKELKPVWRNDVNNSNSVNLPMDIFQSLKPNESYFVMVKVILKNGKEISSKMKEFVIEK